MGVIISSLYLVIMRQETVSSSEISYSAIVLSSFSNSYFTGSGSSNERLSTSLYLLPLRTYPIIPTPLRITAQIIAEYIIP